MFDPLISFDRIQFIQHERVDSLGIGCDRHRPQLKPAIGVDSKARVSLKLMLDKDNVRSRRLVRKGKVLDPLI